MRTYGGCVALLGVLWLVGTVCAETSDIQGDLNECLDRLCSGVRKAFEDVGLTEEGVRAVLAVQAQPQKVWKPYQEAWPAVRKAREQAAAEMAALGPNAVPMLLRARDESWGGTSRGDIFVEAVRKMGMPAVPATIAGLEDADIGVRVRAATALGRIGDPRAVEPVVRLLDDPEPGVVRTAVWALTLLRDQRAADRLLRLWGGGEHGGDIALALGAIGDKRAVEPIMLALKDCADNARETGNWNQSGSSMRAYAGALGQLGEARAIPLLKTVLLAGPQRTKVGERYLVAEAAADALRDLGCHVEGDPEKGGFRVLAEPSRPEQANQTEQ